MNNKTQKTLMVCILFAVTALISWVLYFRQEVDKDTVDIKQFPKTIGTWNSVDIPLTKDDYAILETNNAFVRQYTNSADRSKIYLYLVYSQTNRKVAHPPEICYTGNGMTIIEDVHDSIPVQYDHLTIKANRLRMTKGALTEIAYYWFKVGGHFTANYWKQQGLIAFDTLEGKKPSSALVRISADVVDGDSQKTIANIKKFSDLIASDLFSYLP